MEIIIGSDHAGFNLKEKIKAFLNEEGIKTNDLGTFSEEPIDYPLIAKKVATAVVKNNSLGILICGSGIGMSIAANKIKGVRAALCYDKYTAKVAKAHNNANIICLGARTESTKRFKEIIKTWLETKPPEEERHKRRIQELNEL